MNVPLYLYHQYKPEFFLATTHLEYYIPCLNSIVLLKEASITFDDVWYLNMNRKTGIWCFFLKIQHANNRIVLLTSS